MSKYEKYKPSGIYWIGEIPKHWQILSLKNVLLSMTNGTTITQDPYEEGIPVTRIETISDGVINLENTGIIPSDAGLEAYYLTKGDILFSHINSFEYVANCAIYDLDIKLLHGMNLLRFVPNKSRIEPYYLLYLIKSDYFKKLTQSVCNRAINQVSISNSKLKNFKIVIPADKSEQLTIVSYLDLQTQKIDRLIANKKEQAGKLKELRQIEINNAVTKGLNPNAEMKESGIDWLGEIPKHWDVKHLKRAFNFYNNIRIPLSSEERADLENIFDYYGASGVIDKVDRFLFDGDYILIGEDGANLLDRNSPLAFKASGKFWVNNHAHIIKPVKGDIDFYTFFLESIDFTIYITGSAQPKLTIEAMSGVRVIVPPIDEQIQIAKYLQERTKSIDTLMKNIQTQIEKLQELRKIKIYEAVTGKIKVPT